jgi:predicted GNAT family N-acyltransferase
MTTTPAAKWQLLVAKTTRAKEDVLALRRAVYVDGENRIGEVADFEQTFNRWDTQARYILAYEDDVPVGTVKVIPDSALGLPCSEFVDMDSLRSRGRSVEFGHLIVLPGLRGQGLGMQLMREAFRFSLSEFAAKHIVADLFLDKKDTSTFYRTLGFEVLHGPYQDPRFIGAPESLLMILDVERAIRTFEDPRIPTNRILEFFLAEVANRPGVAASAQ